MGRMFMNSLFLAGLIAGLASGQCMTNSSIAQLSPDSLPIAPKDDRTYHSAQSDLLSHIVGVYYDPPGAATSWRLGPSITGPDTAGGQTWTFNIPKTAYDPSVVDNKPAKFVTLHFTDVNLPGTNKLEVDLGYAKDTFTAASGTAFWTRPINIYKLADAGQPVSVRYITGGSSTTGAATIHKLGVGISHTGEPGHDSVSNCDPFLKDAKYVEPDYDKFWSCTKSPEWDNAACVDNPADVRNRVARSVGMMLGPHALRTVELSGDFLSTCSVTLIDDDEVITAGHCLGSDEENKGTSITFDYATDCDGNRVPAYNPYFYKVKEVLSWQWSTTDLREDYARIRLEEPVKGIPPLQLRPDLAMDGEQVFGIHHPNGAVKKISPRRTGFSTVTREHAPDGTWFLNVPKNFHVTGGTSGSSLFDTAGRIVGVLSRGSPCRNPPFLLRYWPSPSIIQDISFPPSPVPAPRDVVIVLDRSGSMSELDATGRTKIEVARDAVSLFVQLVRRGIGNRIGMVSFSTKASLPVDFPLANFEDSSRVALIGNAPYAQGKVGAMTPGGATSIGDGLDKARLQLALPGTNPKSILLMTDGMENTPPMISDIEKNLAGISVHAVGLGSDKNIDDPLLMQLTSAHGGRYTRAGSGVTLQKFFSAAFGQIFETGVLKDPDYFLPGGTIYSAPVNFTVCGEEAITVAVGWDDPVGDLRINVTTPTGRQLSGASPSVEQAVGRTWTFIRVPLPYNGERDGTWNVTVWRPQQIITRDLVIEERGDNTPLNYFINVIPTGGPRIFLDQDRRWYYTGDTINPKILLRYPDRSWPDEATVDLILTRPNASIGSILSQAGLHQPAYIQGDGIPARQATLRDLGISLGTKQESFKLSENSNDTGGLFESAGVVGVVITDKLVTEGHYQLHFRAQMGDKCISSRELVSSIVVEVGVDPSHTTIVVTVTETTPDGLSHGIAVVTPRDKYDNKLGPGKSPVVTISGGDGTTITGPVVDNGRGDYSVPITWDPKTGKPPTVVITQPERPPVVVQQPGVCTPGGGPGSGTCALCNPQPGGDKQCDITAPCSSTPYGTMCGCRPGYRAAGAVADINVQWRLNWTVPGHEHRVYVAPGQKCDTLCNEWFWGGAACREVSVKAC
jgi:hypothetical protein